MLGISTYLAKEENPDTTKAVCKEEAASKEGEECDVATEEKAPPSKEEDGKGRGEDGEDGEDEETKMDEGVNIASTEQ